MCTAETLESKHRAQKYNGRKGSIVVAASYFYFISYAIFSTQFYNKTSLVNKEQFGQLKLNRRLSDQRH